MYLYINPESTAPSINTLDEARLTFDHHMQQINHWRSTAEKGSYNATIIIGICCGMIGSLLRQFPELAKIQRVTTQIEQVNELLNKIVDVAATKVAP